MNRRLLTNLRSSKFVSLILLKLRMQGSNEAHTKSNCLINLTFQIPGPILSSIANTRRGSKAKKNEVIPFLHFKITFFILETNFKNFRGREKERGRLICFKAETLSLSTFTLIDCRIRRLWKNGRHRSGTQRQVPLLKVN